MRDRWIETVRAPLARPHVIVIAAGKGGVGTTTVALGLAERIAGLRSEQVAVVDGVRTGGTAGLRVAAQPGLGLPALLADLSNVAADGSYTSWARYGVVEHRSRLTVFGRTELSTGELAPDAYRTLLGGLLRLWPIVIVDTSTTDGGTGLAVEVMGSAHRVVVVASYGHASVAATAGWLRSLAVPPERRVGVMTPLSGGNPQELGGLLLHECHQVVTLPNDPAVAGDAPVPMLGNAKRQTLDAFTQLAAGAMTREDQ